MKSALPLILAVVLGGSEVVFAQQQTTSGNTTKSRSDYMHVIGLKGPVATKVLSTPGNESEIARAVAQADEPSIKSAAQKSKKIKERANTGITRVHLHTVDTSSSVSADIASAEMVSGDVVPVAPAQDMAAEPGDLTVVAEGAVVGDSQATVSETLVDPATGQAVIVSEVNKDSALPYRPEEVRVKEVKVS